METKVRLNIPRWVGLLYACMGIVLIPWIVVLAEYLPSKHLARNWDLLWVGFDIMMLIAILVTFYFVIKETIWVIMSASVLATIFIVDAWFDILTARPGREQLESILSGITEISLAILTFRMVYHILHHATPDKSIKVHMRKGVKV
jgi:hypothetical protein